ncbi:terminase gpA endonuclease subunit [Mesorhizobium sp. M2A.F.Ca.ET.039.01.1.1]|uniref:terminase gpA endonuclease subunit n=1 Tax=Mesorhizobium sp. M2A.F.Ca.ET.039.01.1.1 TaxID=2496746 RepID=UPI001FE12D9B|nr:terminase gpA endonuclease subunit [Mesorhizobium sp. M2A.F.Ca.ET.039.01.1.1]
MQTPPKLSPDQWARQNRKYPASAGVPGQRDPSLTPYVIAFTQAVAESAAGRVVAVMGAQMGKTDSELDIVGHRLDQRPAPILWVGPTKEFLVDQQEPRILGLLEEAPRLSAKLQRGKRMKKTRKIVAGVPIRLAHAGSSSALKSDPAALAIVDEYDEMLANIKGQGDPLGLVEARGDTYADFVTVVTSTPSQGHIETEVDPVSGLEFWKPADPDAVKSPIWALFQQGTRYHWAWPCPHCGEYFIPRFSCLVVPKNATPAQARRGSYIQCPYGCVDPIEDHKHKAAMNARGRYVAPGQTIDRDGNVEGAPPDSSTISFWVSGLASPFRTWGQRAERYLTALGSGDDNEIQTAMNAGFGECYTLGGLGETPEWQEVLAKRVPYRLGDLPREVLRITAGVDVQKRSLVYVVRGFGARGSSWLLDFGQIYGPTAEQDVWDELETTLMTPIRGRMIDCVFVDSGFRPGKATAGDEHRVYEFALRFPRWVFATKGHDAQTTPLRPSKIEVLHNGKKAKSSLTLIHLDSDFFKSLVHSRVRMEIGRPGSFHLPLGAEDAGMMSGGVTEDYARQIVSEGRVINPANGKASWVKRFKDNHFLDCEAMAAAAGYMLRVHTIKESEQRSGEDAVQVVVEQPRPAPPPRQKQPDQQAQQAEPQETPRRPRDPWLSADGGGQRRKGWL